MSAETPLALGVRNLSIRLRSSGEALVSDMDLDIPTGEISGLVGGSGSGKSLTALALMGLLEPGTFDVTAAALEIAGNPVDPTSALEMSRLRGEVLAMVFQDPATALDPVFRIGDQVAAPLRRKSGLSRGEARLRAGEALAAVGFDHPLDIMRRFPHELSGGQRQRCVIAMAQAIQPTVLLADEPTTALDTVTQASVLGELERLAEDCGTAVLFISHDLRLMARHARNVNVMHEGRIVERLSGRDLEGGARHAYTRALVEALPEPNPSNDTPGPAEEATDHSAPLLDIRGLHSGYAARGRWWRGSGIRDVVRGIDLTLERGQLHGIAGASGCGKSTIARTIVQLQPAGSGEIRLDGESLLGARGETLNGARRRIQLIFQDPGAALSPRRTVAQTLSEAATHFGLDASEERLIAVLETVDLDATALDRRPHEFSSGQRQRIAIARALICDPDVLVADEALSALDVSVQAQILDLLERLRTERGLAILLISHDLAVLRAHADTVSVMHDGLFVETGPVARLFDAPAHEATRKLIEAMPRLSSDAR